MCLITDEEFANMVQNEVQQNLKNLKEFSDNSEEVFKI